MSQTGYMDGDTKRYGGTLCCARLSVCLILILYDRAGARNFGNLGLRCARWTVPVKCAAKSRGRADGDRNRQAHQEGII